MTARKQGRLCKCGQLLPRRAVRYCGRPECYRCPHGKRDAGRLCVKCMGEGICSHRIQRDYCPQCTPKGVYRSYRNSARKRGLGFELSFEIFTTLLQASCVYCGQQPALGIDRADSTLGYSRTNSVPCCGVDNLAKQSSTREEYLSHITKVYNFQTRRRI